MTMILFMLTSLVMLILSLLSKKMITDRKKTLP